MSVDDPIYRAFISARGCAKERGVEWRLPYWEWLQIWQDSGHLHERGPHKGEWVMGRNGDTGPYEANNVKIIRSETNNEARARAQVRSRAADCAALGSDNSWK